MIKETVDLFSSLRIIYVPSAFRFTGRDSLLRSVNYYTAAPEFNYHVNNHVKRQSTAWIPTRFGDDLPTPYTSRPHLLSLTISDRDGLRVSLCILGQLVVVLAARGAAEAAQGLDGGPDGGVPGAALLLPDLGGGEELVEVAGRHHELEGPELVVVAVLGLELGLGAAGEEHVELVPGVEGQDEACEVVVLGRVLELVVALRVQPRELVAALAPHLVEGRLVRRLLCLGHDAEPLDHQGLGVRGDVGLDARVDGGGGGLELFRELGNLARAGSGDGWRGNGWYIQLSETHLVGRTLQHVGYIHIQDADLEHGEVLLDPAHQGLFRDLLEVGAHEEVVRDDVAHNQLGDRRLGDLGVPPSLLEIGLLDGGHAGGGFEEALVDGEIRVVELGLGLAEPLHPLEVLLWVPVVFLGPGGCVLEPPIVVDGSHGSGGWN
ncbi:hypothetical protein PG985_011438 [Apiospora marii]|uniref:Uncharacterized protein n=1 Tax=Apiospora marii TaxID=335849 RepID=A0ABR1STP3_9PEZI